MKKEVVEDFKSNMYSYNFMKQLLNKEFFKKAKLGAWDVNWHELNEMVDLDTFTFEYAKIIE
ncbi:hypothetical protein JW813_05285 [Clostridium botulinum]|uniref:hypothetical protein n=1 Tax=Clostridium botulinum TaxID=1491 RepID=UPI0022479D0A|nr:hypothetical protein [Clostridium botulinum]UZP04422.1 hypothetical protein JW813_05285 [Clostridium botulinum]UZP07834.1 hypothetical protein JYA71_05560 [Clostridium botulinum]UZP11161.1 hypothetical protein JYA74_05280 [Clostridium botulinum]